LDKPVLGRPFSFPQEADMASRFCAIALGVLAVLVSASGAAFAQAPAAAGDTASQSEGVGALQGEAFTSPEGQITRVSKADKLPNDHGQVFRKYDIEPYTSRVTTTEKPEQAIIDWILRETGAEVWFSEPLGILSANRTTLTVYHTPEMQNTVRSIVDRFVGSEAESQVLGLTICTVGSPNWRSKAHRIMRPVEVQTPGVNAWLLTRENAAVLLADLRKRTDYKEYGAPNLQIHNGQSSSISRLRPRNYTRSVNLDEQTFAGHTLIMGNIEEGFTLEISPLLTLDRQILDAVIKVQVDQVEKLVPVVIDVPTPTPERQRIEIQVPQVVSAKMHERFRWPSDHVLLISGGVSATPAPQQGSLLGTPVPNPFGSGPSRADALLFVEYRGKASQALLQTDRGAGTTGTPQTRGRY
jgi:hypothetical protein